MQAKCRSTRFSTIEDPAEASSRMARVGASTFCIGLKGRGASCGACTKGNGLGAMPKWVRLGGA